ncbi:MAG: hypothetical protein L6437_11195 [Kiritimatiellae bacterium]|nr:hypothetical protein [Kiritimatiellia bacterium]
MSTDTRSEGQKFRDTLLLQGAGEVPIWCGFSLATCRKRVTLKIGNKDKNSRKD